MLLCVLRRLLHYLMLLDVILQRLRMLLPLLLQRLLVLRWRRNLVQTLYLILKACNLLHHILQEHLVFAVYQP